MKAAIIHGDHDVRVEAAPDPWVLEPTDRTPEVRPDGRAARDQDAATAVSWFRGLVAAVAARARR